MVWLLAGILPFAGFSQQLPHYTMYMANNFVINPAVAGIEPYTDLKLAARSQWVGLADAPRTAYLTAHAPLTHATANRSKLGMGAKVFADRTGPISRMSGEVDVAYHLPLSPVYRLSFGVGVGAFHQRLSMQRIRLDEQLDPFYNYMAMSSTSPQVHAGLWFYTIDLYAGLSSNNLLDGRPINETMASTGFELRLRRHYFATAGYRFRFGDLQLTPSVLCKFVAPLPTTFDVNVKAQFADICWAGLSWRQGDSVGAMAGFFVSRSLNVAYAYDFTHSDLRRHTTGSHEIILGIVLNNEWGPKCPTIVW